MRIARFRIAGIGCRPGTGVDTLAAALRAAGGAQVLASVPERAAELRPLARLLDLPLHLVAVAGVATPTQSPRILALHATGSVAEAAALVAAGLVPQGRGARLLRPRTVHGPVTIAIAEVP